MMTEEQVATRLRELDADDDVLFERLARRSPREAADLRDAGLALLARNGIPTAQPSHPDKTGRGR